MILIGHSPLQFRPTQQRPPYIVLPRSGNQTRAIKLVLAPWTDIMEEIDLSARAKMIRHLHSE
ncbi:hypothetical protein CY34DRAFT_808382 [Suillus luteus UH-Slu-Lm8-n1]|uniref:Uncharacterized protein n=1 Tax=Suillus luteus UH-Slu-Lm8-n1 TaxID=930992 RepID=A0A0D0AC85_9AGAM|nr:hypothetical protein CY34DRAFT_808382 [Suillus luteus UH-Slu-Lm8-n1]